jgi:hypothetical protein
VWAGVEGRKKEPPRWSDAVYRRAGLAGKATYPSEVHVHT